MTVDLSIEAIAAIVGATGALILALILALTITVRTLSKVVKTILALNDELQENSTERRGWSKERGELSTVVATLTGQIGTIQDDCTKREETISAKLSEFEQRSQEREEQMNAEIKRLNTRVLELESEIDRLEKELKIERDLRRRDLDTFNTQIAEKDHKIEELKAERETLKKRLDALEANMNGKVDKAPPPVTGAADTITETKEI